MDTSSVGGVQPKVFQFSLLSLLLGIALLSVPLTLLHWLGAIYLFSVALSTCLITICIIAYKPQSQKKFAHHCRLCCSRIDCYYLLLFYGDF